MMNKWAKRKQSMATKKECQDVSQACCNFRTPTLHMCMSWTKLIQILPSHGALYTICTRSWIHAAPSRHLHQICFWEASAGNGYKHYDEKVHGLDVGAMLQNQRIDQRFEKEL